MDKIQIQVQKIYALVKYTIPQIRPLWASNFIPKSN